MLNHGPFFSFTNFPHQPQTTPPENPRPKISQDFPSKSAQSQDLGRTSLHGPQVGPARDTCRLWHRVLAGTLCAGRCSRAALGGLGAAAALQETGRGWKGGDLVGKP